MIEYHELQSVFPRPLGVLEAESNGCRVIAYYCSITLGMRTYGGQTLAQARTMVDAMRARGIEAYIDGYLY